MKSTRVFFALIVLFAFVFAQANLVLGETKYKDARSPGTVRIRIGWDKAIPTGRVETYEFTIHLDGQPIRGDGKPISVKVSGPIDTVAAKRKKIIDELQYQISRLNKQIKVSEAEALVEPPEDEFDLLPSEGNPDVNVPASKITYIDIGVSSSNLSDAIPAHSVTLYLPNDAKKAKIKIGKKGHKTEAGNLKISFAGPDGKPWGEDFSKDYTKGVSAEPVKDAEGQLQGVQEDVFKWAKARYPGTAKEVEEGGLLYVTFGPDKLLHQVGGTQKWVEVPIPLPSSIAITTNEKGVLLALGGSTGAGYEVPSLLVWSTVLAMFAGVYLLTKNRPSSDLRSSLT